MNPNFQLIFLVYYKYFAEAFRAGRVGI